MFCDPTQCFLEQFFSRQDFVPWGRARGVRQWNHIAAVPGACDPEFAADYLLQSVGQAGSFPYNRCAADKLHDSESAHGDDKTRSQNPDLVVHP
jgi:hypothetical protein